MMVVRTIDTKPLFCFVRTLKKRRRERERDAMV